MFYPTGKLPSGKTLVCLDDCRSEVDEATKSCTDDCLVECMTGWMNENNCCCEEWQFRDYLKKKGMKEKKVNEDVGAGLATLGNVNGMGNVASPSNGGTNAGFYDSSLNGSGDNFSATRRSSNKKTGTSRKSIKTYSDFLKKRKKK